MENHSHALTEQKKALGIALAITAAVMLVEVAGGFLSGSLALLADAGHMLTDAAALGLSLFAFWLSGRPKTVRRTFGWRRFEVFAAFVNGVALWAIAAVITYEAFQRLTSPPQIKSGLMMVIAAAGLVSNAVAGAILYRRRERSLNLKGAFLHVTADALGSLGVLIAALLIKTTGSLIWDPIVSLGVCVLILWSSARLIRDSFHIFMEGAPGDLDVAVVEKALAEVPGVVSLHDLHIWTITSEFVSLSAHLKVRAGAEAKDVLRRAHEAISSRFKVLHSTFQIEPEEDAVCATESCDETPLKSA
jgi:cobalt-zinc-cadmium efflux system protein